MDIGFIGLGVMGAPMATHLAHAGHRLTLLDANASVTRDVAASLGHGAVAATTPREVAVRSEVIVTMLPNGQVVQQVALGEDGLVQGLRRGAILLDTSSCEPWLTEQTGKALGERGAAMVDAPVSGAAWGAQEAKLVFMVGGADEDVARIRPLLDVMGRAVFHLGGLGSGHAMKCINNCITAVTLANTAEGLVAGKRYGLDPKVMVDVLNESTGGSWITQTHFNQRVFNRAFNDPFKLELISRTWASRWSSLAKRPPLRRSGASASSCGAWPTTPPAPAPASASWCAGSRSSPAPSSRPAPSPAIAEESRCRRGSTYLVSSPN